jgi:hypothetical protein
VRGQLKRPPNRNGHALNILQHIRIYKPQYLKSFSFKEPLPCRVGLFSFTVVLTVQLDDDFGIKTGEVSNEVAD